MVTGNQARTGHRRHYTRKPPVRATFRQTHALPAREYLCTKRDSVEKKRKGATMSLLLPPGGPSRRRCATRWLHDERRVRPRNGTPCAGICPTHTRWPLPIMFFCTGFEVRAATEECGNVSFYQQVSQDVLFAATTPGGGAQSARLRIRSSPAAARAVESVRARGRSIACSRGAGNPRAGRCSNRTRAGPA